MLAGIMMAVLGGAYEVFLKKSLAVSTVSERLFMLVGQAAGYVLVPVLILWWGVDRSVFSDGFAVVAMAVVALCWYLSELFRQRAYDREKVSVLLPWSNLTPLLLVVIGYLLFADASLPAFVVALVSVATLTAYGFWDGEVGFSKGVLWFLASVACDVPEMLLSAWVVKSYPVPTFVVVALCMYYALILGLSARRSVWAGARSQSGKFWAWRLATSVVWYGYWYLEVFLFSEVGVVMTTLLACAQMVIQLALGKWILGDKSRLRDIVLAAFLVLMAAVGYALN